MIQKAIDIRKDFELCFSVLETCIYDLMNIIIFTDWCTVSVMIVFQKYFQLEGNIKYTLLSNFVHDVYPKYVNDVR